MFSFAVTACSKYADAAANTAAFSHFDAFFTNSYDRAEVVAGSWRHQANSEFRAANIVISKKDR
jgi:hypothetical protein